MFVSYSFYIYIYTCHKRYSRHLIYTPCGAHLSNIWHVIRITHAWLYARPWRYNHEVEEFFVEDESTVTIRKSDLTRRTETTELEVSCPNICSVIQWLRHTTCCPPTHGSSSAHNYLHMQVYVTYLDECEHLVAKPLCLIVWWFGWLTISLTIIMHKRFYMYMRTYIYIFTCIWIFLYTCIYIIYNLQDI